MGKGRYSDRFGRDSMVRVVIGSGGRGALQGWLRVGHEGSLDNSGAKPKAGELSPLLWGGAVGKLGRSSGFLAARKVVKVGCKLVQVVGSCKSLMIASCG